MYSCCQRLPNSGSRVRSCLWPPVKTFLHSILTTVVTIFLTTVMRHLHHTTDKMYFWDKNQGNVSCTTVLLNVTAETWNYSCSSILHVSALVLCFLKAEVAFLLLSWNALHCKHCCVTFYDMMQPFTMRDTLQKYRSYKLVQHLSLFFCHHRIGHPLYLCTTQTTLWYDDEVNSSYVVLLLSWGRVNSTMKPVWSVSHFTHLYCAILCCNWMNQKAGRNTHSVSVPKTYSFAHV